MYKGTLGVQEIEFVVKSTPSSRDGGCVRQHAHAARYLGEIATGDVSWRLVADTELEASRTPVNELDRTFCLDNGNSGVYVFRNDITTVQQRASH